MSFVAFRLSRPHSRPRTLRFLVEIDTSGKTEVEEAEVLRCLQDRYLADVRVWRLDWKPQTTAAAKRITERDAWEHKE